MSRIGKHPVPVPSGVTVGIEGQTVTAKGKLGALVATLPPEVVITFEDGKVTVTPARRGAAVAGDVGHVALAGAEPGQGRRRRASRAGSRSPASATVPRSTARCSNLQLGYSHDIKFAVPEDIKIVCETPTAMTISGADKQRVGQIAAEIRGFRPPEPYKGKGVKYAEETYPPQGRQEEVGHGEGS